MLSPGFVSKRAKLLRSSAPTEKARKMWETKLVSGQWMPVARVILAIKIGTERAKKQLLLSSIEISRFHEDEAITDRLGITERVTNERNVLYCRLTPYGEAVAKVYFSPSCQAKLRAANRESSEGQRLDAILGEP